MNTIRWFVIFLLDILALTDAFAFDKWTVSLTPQAMSGSYSSSPVRDRMTSEGLLLNLQYLERSAVLLGYFPLQLHYKNGIPELNQQTDYISLRSFQTPDSLGGWLTLRLDGYRVNNNDPIHETDDVNVVEPLISYINYAKTYYMDLGYAQSWYGNSNIGRGQLTVSQVAPTVGFGFNDNLDWIRFRLYETYVSNRVRAQNVTHANGVETKFSQYILYYPFYIPNRIDLDVFLGNNIYAVDSDALFVYNLGDVQRNGVYIQANWRLSQHVDFIVNTGHLNFTTLIQNTKYPYALNYIYGGINIHL